MIAFFPGIVWGVPNLFLRIGSAFSREVPNGIFAMDLICLFYTYQQKVDI